MSHQLLVKDTSTKNDEASLNSMLKQGPTKKRLPKAVTAQRDTLQGKLYLKLVRLAEKYNLNWEPNEPQDSLQREWYALLAEIRHIAVNECKQINVSVAGSKGGTSKTILIAFLAIIYKLATGVPTLLAEFHQQTGTIAERLGVNDKDPDMVMLFKIFNNPSLIENHSVSTDIFSKYVEPASGISNYGEPTLDVLLAEQNAGELDVPSIETVVKVALELSKHYHSVFFDTGNGQRGPMNEGVALASDVIAFPVLAHDDAGFRPTITTMQSMQDKGYHEKVRSGPKVVCATDPNDTKEKYLDKYRDRAKKLLQKENWKYKSPWPNTSVPQPDDYQDIAEYQEALVDLLMKDLGITPENIFLLPKSDYIANNGVASVKRKTTGIITLIAYAKVLLHILQAPTSSIADKWETTQAVIEERTLSTEERRRNAEERAKLMKFQDELIKLRDAYKEDDPNIAVQFTQVAEFILPKEVKEKVRSKLVE